MLMGFLPMEILPMKLFAACSWFRCKIDNSRNEIERWSDKWVTQTSVLTTNHDIHAPNPKGRKKTKTEEQFGKQSQFNVSIEPFNINNMYGTEFWSQEQQYQGDWVTMLVSSTKTIKDKGKTENPRRKRRRKRQKKKMTPNKKRANKEREKQVTKLYIISILTI